MPDNSPYDTASRLADQEFAHFRTLLANAGVDAKDAWNMVEAAKGQFDAVTSSAESNLNDLMETEFISDNERYARRGAITKARDDAAKEARARLDTGMAIVEAALIEARKSDFKLAENPAQRQIIREDVRMALAGVAGSGLDKLLALARSNPEVAAELFHGFGEAMLKEKGADRDILRSWRKNIVTLTEPQTPKAKAARAALQSLGRLKGFANVTIPQAAQARIEAASKPRVRDGFRPDTIGPHGRR